MATKGKALTGRSERMVHIIDGYFAYDNNYGYTVIQNTGRKKQKRRRNLQDVGLLRDPGRGSENGAQ